MRCRHCGSPNSEHEHRCHHCGRWLQGAQPVYPIENSAAVPALSPEPAPAEEDRTQSGRPLRQASLFASDRPKVIPFESAAAGRIARDRLARAGRQTQPAQQTTAVRASQQSLDFRPRAQRQQAVFLEAPIAGPRVRLKAAIADAGILALGVALAAATFVLMGGQFILTHRAPLFYGCAVAAMALFYQLVWSVLGRETAGMRLFRLRLVTFDGSTPAWRLRVLRLAATCLGIVAAGMGLVWALVDEEKLTWQDHISKTFPTVHNPNPGTFHRK